MSTRETVDALLRFLEILLSWPVILLIFLLLVRHQLPSLAAKLADRITKAPGGFEFAVLQQVKEQVATIQETVERIEQDLRFVPSPELTADVQQHLDQTLRRYLVYLQRLGFKPETDHINIRIAANDPVAWFDFATNTISIGSPFVGDLDVALREYTYHALNTSARLAYGDWSEPYLGVASGLADYFPCSFMDDPLFGEVVGRKHFPQPYIRNLANERSFDVPPVDRRDFYSLGEIWGGAFWELRQLLGQDRADQLIFATWASLRPTDLRSEDIAAFPRALLSGLTAEENRSAAQQVREVFTRRGVQLE